MSRIEIDAVHQYFFVDGLWRGEAGEWTRTMNVGIPEAESQRSARGDKRGSAGRPKRGSAGRLGE